MYLSAMDAIAALDNKEHSKHLWQVIEQNASLLSLVQEEQKDWRTYEVE